MSVALTRLIRPGLEKKWHLFPLTVILGFALGALVSFKPAIGLALPLLALFCLAIIPRPKLGLYAIAAWVPFESLAGFGSDFSATKLIAAITFLGWLARLYKTKSSYVNLNETPHLFLLAFLAAATLSLINAKHFGEGLIHLTTLAMLAMLYFVIIDLIDNEKSLRIFVSTLIFSTSLAATISIAQFISSRGTKAGGAYLDPNGSALGLVVVIPLIFMFLWSPAAKPNYSFWLALFLLVFGAFVTTSRGALAALLAMLVMLAGEKLLDAGIRRKIIVLLLIMVLLIAFVAVFLDKRFTLSTITESKGAGRFDIWATGLMIFPDYWLTGVGLANYKFVYVQYSQLIPGISPQYRKPLGGHNVFLEVAVETGILGLLTLLGFFLSVLYQSRQLRLRQTAAGNLGSAANSAMFSISLVGLIVACFALGALYMKIIWLVLALSACQALRTNEA